MIKHILERHGANAAALVMRIGFGGFMAMNHGLPKLLSFSEKSATFASFLPTPGPLNMALAIFGELVCPLLIVIGLGTRVVAVPALITMLVAALGAHGDDITGDGEHALLFAFGYLAIALMGPGAWSVDSRITWRKRA